MAGRALMLTSRLMVKVGVVAQVRANDLLMQEINTHALMSHTCHSLMVSDARKVLPVRHRDPASRCEQSDQEV